MSDFAIKVEGLSKKYKLTHANREKSLVGSSISSIKNIFTRNTNTKEDFWALKDINFEIKKGDRVGIVGRNGAGKSTLLKILSRIVAPTTGKIEYEGRMASLLEVGTGFHGDLSGRENIYLNGSILGMSKSEIDKKFDEIVAFSEVERFLDTPVKRYSSGMYVRLAFAVAAHLEPDILIVDEVLAVGDAAFQKKSMGKMEEVNQKDGRTILFVSHSMQSVQKLCNVGIYLKNGELIKNGNIDTIVSEYVNNGENTNGKYILTPPETIEFGYVTQLTIENIDENILNEIPVGSGWKVRIKFKIIKNTPHFIAGLGIVTSLDMPLRTVWSEPNDTGVGEYEIVFDLSDILFTTGDYKIIVGLSSNQRTFQYINNVFRIKISDAGEIAHNKKVVNTESGLILNPAKTIIKNIS